MTVRKWKNALAATLLLTASLPMIAVADDDDNDWRPRWGMGQMMGRMMGQWGSGGPMNGWGQDGMLDRIDGRLAFLKTELKITEAQTPQWDELATEIRDTAETHNALMRSMMEEMRDGSFLDKPLPERLAYQETIVEARLEQVKSIKSAVEKLYAVLDDEQKKAADEIVLPMMGMGMGRGGGRGMMGWR